MTRDTLTREQIVKAAIDLLDDEGLEGLNMRALGRRLGSAATAVYWHVGSKENLIRLAGDQAWNEIARPDLAGVGEQTADGWRAADGEQTADRWRAADGEQTADGWRAAAAEMAAGLYAMLTRHPWLLQAFGSFLMFGPGKARHDDHNLAIYEAAGFAGAQADQASSTVFTFVLGNAMGAAAAASLTRKLSREGGDADQLMADAMAQAREIAAQFPRLQARLGHASADYGAAPDDSFEFGLRTILDGLAAQLAARP
jgi:AcrR family transcriptional regulator